MHRAIAHLDFRTGRGRRLFLPAASAPAARPNGGGSDALPLRDHGFQQLHRLLIHGAADVAGADVMVVGVHAGHFAIQGDALHPVLLAASPAAGPALGGRLLAQVRRECRLT